MDTTASNLDILSKMEFEDGEIDVNFFDIVEFSDEWNNVLLLCLPQLQVDHLLILAVNHSVADALDSQLP